MANKATTQFYRGMNQDMSQSGYPKGFYFEGRNIRIIATDSQSTTAATNEKGNLLIYQVPIPVINYERKEILYNDKSLLYTTDEISNLAGNDLSQPGTQYIIGHTTTRRYVVLFTSDENGFDCIWRIDLESATYDIELLYLRSMLLSREHPIQALNNFENKLIDKVYWVDGLHQMRFINIEQSIENEDLENLIDTPLDTINMVGRYDLSQPSIIRIVAGGVHTSGMIQYAYNLYRLNSSQTRLSPLSPLVSLDKDLLGGGALNEIVGQTPIVSITDIDENYTHLKVYAIKYTSLNQNPTISLIDDREVPTSRSVEIFDDGKVIASVSLEEFLFLGSDILIPRHINSKDNRLFFANYEEKNFVVNVDTRAYSFDSNLTSFVYDNIQLYNGQDTPDIDGITGEQRQIFPDEFTDDPEDKFDSINLDYDAYKYQSDGVTLGGEGFHVYYQLTQTTEFDPDARYFKDNEIYRLGIEFMNNYGQYSLPKWVADFKAPEGNLEGKYNTLVFNLTLNFHDWLNNEDNFETEYDKPVGYRVLVAERTISDRTIVASGIISPMMINEKSNVDTVYPGGFAHVRNKSDQIPKLPNILLRNVGPTPTQFNRYFGANTRPLEFAQHLQQMSVITESADTEMQRAFVGNLDTNGRFYQYSTMYQLYCPELIFNESVELGSGLIFKVKGGYINKYNTVWGKSYRQSKSVGDEGKALGGLSLDPLFNLEFTSISGDGTNTTSNGLIGHPLGSEDDDDINSHRIPFLSWYRGYGDVIINDSIDTVPLFDKYFIPSTIRNDYGIYGAPEIAVVGQNVTTYNKDPKYRYINTFLDIRTDKDSGWADTSPFGRSIISGNSDNNRCINFVLGADDASVNSYDRPSMESLYDDAGFGSSTNLGIIGELCKSREQIYLGNIYGGNSFEDKKRSRYLEVGNYINFQNIIPIDNVINSPGDTFVNQFKFQRVIPKQPFIPTIGVAVWQEIVEYRAESTIDLKNRNDVSFSSWDSQFHYIQSDYQQYNRVYSQQSNLMAQRDLDFNVKKVNSFDTNIIATKQKSAGEIIDSWTDVLQNEVMTLDGKYGAINSFPVFNDELYAIQDKAFAFLSINPRVQVQGNDGLAIELGTGGVLNDYKYITTDSGTLNKWGVIASPQGLYFYDALNSSFNAFRGNVTGLSDVKGLHTFFINNVSLNDIKIDNPLLQKGISAGYDYVNNDALFTFRQESKPDFTFSFNEMADSFVSFYDYLPTMYISKGSFLITVHPDDTKLYRQFAGEYNKFFEVKYRSSVIFNVNPEPHFDCVFDNINFKSEVYLNNVDQPDKTITHIQAYNDYQDSGLIPLVVGRNNNLRRKFRDWNALIPRQGRERIRAPWIKLKVEFDNTANYKLILHNLNIFYTI